MQASAAQSELLRRQEELERKAAELDRREREMQGIAAGTGQSGRVNFSLAKMFSNMMQN